MFVVICYSTIKKLICSLGGSDIPQGWESLLQAMDLGNFYVIYFQTNTLQKLCMEYTRDIHEVVRWETMNSCSKCFQWFQGY